MTETTDFRVVNAQIPGIDRQTLLPLRPCPPLPRKEARVRLLDHAEFSLCGAGKNVRKEKAFLLGRDRTLNRERLRQRELIIHKCSNHDKFVGHGSSMATYVPDWPFSSSERARNCSANSKYFAPRSSSSPWPWSMVSTREF